MRRLHSTYDTDRGRFGGARAVRRSRAAGFTLVELMVTILVSTIVMAATYLMYTSSVRGYRIEDESLGALNSLRVATDQLRLDLRSAAFNAPAQSNSESWVTPPQNTVLSAVSVDTDINAPVALPSTNMNIAPQEIRLLGDFWSHHTYTTEMINGTTVTLRWTAAEDGDKTTFDRIFNSRRMLRVETYGVARQEQYIPIASASWNSGVNPTIDLTAPVQNIVGFGSGNEVSVCGYVRYRLLRDTRRDQNSLKYNLIREDLNPDGTVINGTALIVAENIVDLQVYDICMNTTAPTPGSMRQVPVQIQCFANLQALKDAGYSLAPDATNQSELLRSMTVKIDARTADEDPTLDFLARQSEDSPLHTFELDTKLPGSARVFEMASTVFFTGIQARRQ